MQLPPWAPTLTDGVVTLRAHRRSDVDRCLEQCRDPQTQRWTTIPVPYERADALEFLDSREGEWNAGRYLAFAVETGTGFAGTVDVRPDGAGGAAVGYGLGPWARGRGTAQRALRLLLRWAFDTLELEVVHWHALAGNWASRRVAWSVGFRVEGTVRGLLSDRGSRADGWIGSLRRDDPLTAAHDWLLPPVLSGAAASGGRVTLRPHRGEDAEAMAVACADALTRHWLPQLPSPYTPIDARAHLEQIAQEQADGNAIYWAVGEGALRGEIGLFGLARGASRTAEIGYWTHPGARGRGLTTQAVRLAARHALLPRDVGGLGLARVVIRAAEGNVASQRVALGAGFRRTGTDRAAELLRDGTVQDLWRFDLIAQELRA